MKSFLRRSSAKSSATTPKMKFTDHSPTTSRLLIILGLTVLAIGVATQLDPVQNTAMAKGAAIAIAVLGLSWLTGLSGQVSIGNSGFMMVGAYAAAIWATHHPVPPSFGGVIGPSYANVLMMLFLATVSGLLAGLIVGIPGTRLRGPYLAGFTIAFAVVLPQFVTTLGFTGGSGGLFTSTLSIPRWFASLFNGSTPNLAANAEWLTDFTLVVAAIAFFFMANLFNSKTGRAMRLVRDNDVAAELVGVNLPRTKTLAFVISAAYGGLSGGLFLLITPNVNGDTFPFTLSVILLTVMVLGGIGTLSGAVIGGMIYAFSGPLISHLNSLTGVDPASNLGINMKGILFGGVLMLTMLLAPRGIAGLVAKLPRRRKKLPRLSSKSPA